MSDGHFNRSFLPHGDFSSGVRVGRASERAICIKAFGEMLESICPEASDEVKATWAAQFKALVLQSEK